MKRIWLIIGLVMSFFASNSVVCAQNFDDGTKTVHRAIKKAILVIQNKYELQLAGIKEAGDNENKYKEVGIYLSSKKYLSKDEGRKIILDISHILLEHLNQEEVRPYLSVNPFVLENISIGITYAVAEKDFSQIQSCRTFTGKLYYWYDIPNEMGKMREEYESYEEALKLNEEVGDISTPITIPLADPNQPKKRSWWSSLFGN